MGGHGELVEETFDREHIADFAGRAKVRGRSGVVVSQRISARILATA